VSDGLSLLDTAIIRLAANGKSPKEIGAELGIPAEKALIRTKEILASRDVWTEVEQRQLLLNDLFRLKESIQAELEHGWEKDSSAALLKTVKLISDIMERQGKITEEELTTITQTQARALLGLVQAAWLRARELLEAEYSNYVDVAQIEAAFQTGLREAAINE
jgi:hypothetical protein